MANTTIQVTKQTRDHLAELAEERGLSIGQLVDALAAAEPTAAQRAEQAAAARVHAREVIGVDVSDEEFASLDVLGNLRQIAAEKILAVPGRDAA
jgi:predicted DNA-binding ribbon-helix-helix protein